MVSGVDVLSDVLCFWLVNVVLEHLVHQSHLTVKDMPSAYTYHQR